jgi:hypothetical protein
MATRLVPRRPPARYPRGIRVLMPSVACYSLVLALLVATASGVLRKPKRGTEMRQPCDG